MAARILVVDDNRSNLDLMLYLLDAFGYEAEGASDGLAGIEAVGRADFDAVLVDILMPGIDGYEFARRYRTDPSRREKPLIAVTALVMVGDRERLLASGFDGYIAKPIDPQAFVAQVEAYLPEGLRSSKMRASAAGIAKSREEPAGPLVLAVDDVPENLEFIDAALRSFGYRVVDASSVQEAIELLDDIRPAVVVCDLHMPTGSGLELVQHVRADQETRDVPFIFLSSTSWKTAEHRRGLELGAQKFLLRPIDPEDLRKEIEQLIGA
jgi:CheY-like chemotaxis protein